MIDIQNPSDPISWPDDDPIVADVRAQRDAIAAEVNYDLDALYARLKALEDIERAQGRVILPPPSGADAAA